MDAEDKSESPALGCESHEDEVGKLQQEDTSSLAECGTCKKAGEMRKVQNCASRDHSLSCSQPRREVSGTYEAIYAELGGSAAGTEQRSAALPDLGIRVVMRSWGNGTAESAFANWMKWRLDTEFCVISINVGFQGMSVPAWPICTRSAWNLKAMKGIAEDEEDAPAFRQPFSETEAKSLHQNRKRTRDLRPGLP